MQEGGFLDLEILQNNAVKVLGLAGFLLPWSMRRI
jgi:hypothetical protein